MQLPRTLGDVCVDLPMTMQLHVSEQEFGMALHITAELWQASNKGQCATYPLNYQAAIKVQLTKP